VWARACVRGLGEAPGAVRLATNIFVHEDDEWRLVPHHASVLGSGQGQGPGPGGGTGPGAGDRGGLVN